MKNVLLLGSHGQRVRPLVENIDKNIIEYSGPFDVDYLNLNRIDMIVSFGYRHIIKQNVLEKFPGRVVNLHISYLPWNRGADPNLWSFLEETPKGVTIHHIDEGIDTGDIIAQEIIHFHEEETLATSYIKLCNTVLKLFKTVWPEIEYGTSCRTKQGATGSFHKTNDRKKYEHLLVSGWNTPVKYIRGKAILT